MNPLIYRYNGRFFVNKNLLSLKANNTEVCNALYTAISEEFTGASKNPLYSRLTIAEKMSKVNIFAQEWLKQRGLD
jgi:hypothetical protein